MTVTNNNNIQCNKPCGYKVAPRKKVELRRMATAFRALLAAEGCYGSSPNYLDVSTLLEKVLYQAGYILHILPDKELSETAAFTIPDRRLIVMRESVYDALGNHDAFSRYTAVHEFCHIVLEHSVTLHRGAELGKHEWYEDSEWQANNLTAEIMMPVEVVLNLQSNVRLIAQECGVSYKAAKYRVENLRKENLI